MTAGLTLELSAEQVEAIVERVKAEVRREQQAQPEPWLDVRGAAEHLVCPPGRIYALVSAGRIPHARDGKRLLFRRSELDAWVRAGGARRP